MPERFWEINPFLTDSFNDKYQVMEKKPITQFSAGLIIAALLIIYSMILTFMELSANQALSFISYIIMIVGLVYFIPQYGKSVDNTATFGQLFTFGLKTSAVTTLTVIAFQVIFFLVFPEYKEKLFELSRENMLKQGSVTEAQAEQGVEMMKRFFWVGLIGGSMFFLMIIGAIGSLIGAGITKKNPRSPFTTNA